MPRLAIRTITSQGSGKTQPKLYNAKRQIESSRGLDTAGIRRLEGDEFWQGWRERVSQDVVKFIDEYEGRDVTGQPIREMLHQEKLKLLRSPARYFSRPQNVPERLRQQMYFPDFTVTLIRTPHLGPFFAQFQVPLNMGKLDFKSYLKNVYNVDVHHVRSFVVHQQPEREPAVRKYQQGRMTARAFKKKMTVQLVEPFEWPPELPKERLDSQDFEKTKYWETMKKSIDLNRERQEDFVQRPNLKHRRSLAEQARALLEGREKWQPTWKQIPTTVRAMEGQKLHQLSSMENSQSLLR